MEKDKMNFIQDLLEKYAEAEMESGAFDDHFRLTRKM